ncbi:uncharacterized protein LOC135148218 [Daucus carota subsp. sativus]|uniref:uncharacterized protein LOC135148212 n=1 Tax=Daucus carota subsp. sativus TaxID=79200 RepID=UPI003083C804
MFTETLAAKFPECRLPEPGRSVLRGRSSSNVKVILDTTSANSGLDANGWAKKVLLSGKVVFVERNCSKEPIYLKELEELVGKEKVRFPMVIVNGKDLCREEEVESLDDFKNKQKLIMSALNVLYVTERELKSLPFGRRSSIDGAAEHLYPKHCKIVSREIGCQVPTMPPSYTRRSKFTRQFFIINVET